jgi:drug/metabolite transporter (DMT)-like permease
MAVLAILAGACFSIVAIAYRLGAPRGVGPVHVMGTCSLLGAAFFGVQALGAPGGGAGTLVVALGLLAGVTQYALLPLIRAALRLGPLSPLWCVLMLSFIPTTLYAALALGETLGPLNYAAMAAAVLCVGLACVGKGGSAAGVGAGPRHRLRYAAVLAAMLMIGAVAGVCLKELDSRGDGAGGTLLARHRDAYIAVMYAAIAACAVTDVTLTRGRPASWRWTIGLGLMAAAGSLTGMSLLVRAAVLPAAVVFTLNSVSSIVFTSLVAAALLGEKRTWSWYATLACGLLAVALSNGEAIITYLREGSS